MACQVGSYEERGDRWKRVTVDYVGLIVSDYAIIYGWRGLFPEAKIKRAANNKEFL